MTFAKTLILGAAGAVMISGSALAADPPPVNMAMTTPPAPVAIGPDVTIDVIGLLGVGVPIGFGLQSSAYVNVEWPSGWGVELDAFGYTPIWPSFGVGGDGQVRVYRSFGDLEVGLGAAGGFNCFPCGGGFGLNANLFYEYESDRLTVTSENYLWYFPVIDFDSWTEVEFQVTDALLLEGFLSFEGGFDEVGIMATYSVNDRLDVWGALELGGGWDAGLGVVFDVTPALEVTAEAWFEPGGIDWVGLTLTYEANDWLTLLGYMDFNFPGWSVGGGALFERQIGTGPLSLIAFGQVGYNGGGPLFLSGAVGIRYSLGDVDDFSDLFFEGGP